MHGQVVQAIQGQRQQYRAIQSRLTDSHTLPDVLAAILQVYPFDCVYIADLNAITGQQDQPHHLALIEKTMRSFPKITWWVDAGFNKQASLNPWLDAGMRPVLASECMTDINDYQALRDKAPSGILSLDFFQDGYHGPATLLSQPQMWTQPCILMSLPKVGANQGPATQSIEDIKNQHPTQQLYAAGGVRHRHDLLALKTAGAQGVLVASAIHQQQLSTEDITQIIK